MFRGNFGTRAEVSSTLSYLCRSVLETVNDITDYGSVVNKDLQAGLPTYEGRPSELSCTQCMYQIIVR